MSKESWMWLACGLGWGAVNTGELLNAYPGGADEILDALGSPKLDDLLTQKQAERLAQSRPADFSLRIAHAATQGITTLGFDDVDYPGTLRSIHNPPPVLFVKGDVGLLNGRLSIGMVGARRPSAYGVEAMKAIGRGVALGGAIIVSGLAAGLDSEAHKAALAVNGPTIACIAFGHDNCYPAANKKLMEVIERHGAVVSEYPLGTGPEKPYFLHRNRIIAGLSHGLVVVEARRYSGTMSTVNFAIDYGRDVFGVPGSIFSDLSGGTNAMVREGAYLAGSASDVLAVYGIQLEVEDPVAAAAKQAVEGRPQAAAAAPAWQQSLNRYTERTREERAQTRSEELPGQQSLGELLRSQLNGGAGSTGSQVTAAQAVEAFRQLQKQLPATDDSELDARNQMLDEMVAAVSDSVEIGKKPAKSTKPPLNRAYLLDEPEDEAANGKKVQPFPWHQVERVDKKELKKAQAAPVKPIRPQAVPQPGQGAARSAEQAASPQATEAQSQSLGARLFGLGSPPGGAAQPASRGRSAGRIEPVSAVGGVAAVPPVRPVQAVSPNEMEATPRVAPEGRAERTRPARQADRPSAAAAPAVPVPAQERPSPVSPARPDTSLTGRLSSLRGTAQPPRSAEQPARSTEQAAHEPDSRAALRAAAAAQAREETNAPLPKLPVLDAHDFEPDDPQELLSESAKKALAQLGPKPVGLADICEGSGLTSAQAMAALTELELAGLSRQLAGRQFVIYQ